MWQAVLLSWWLFGTLASCCPQYCRCFTDDDGYKVANCSRSGLVSGDPAPTIDVLNFKNQIRGTHTKLEARIFRNFRGVRYLNLQNTSISQLPTDVFYGLNRVSRLDLSFNKIKHLNGVVFKSLPNLRYLSLRGNFLSISPLEVIVSETLQDLDMGYCSITNIPLYTFSSAPNIRQLILDGNFIQTLEYNVLPKGVTYLNLANNNIVKPPISVFNSLRHLVRLDISNNPINCSCSLLVFQDTLSGRAGILENDVRCNNPSHLFGKEISTVNENQLCRDDYMNREGLNNLIHLRTKKSHHHNHHQYNVQSDEPLMGDESYGTREAAEVMFTNDETNQMGTHMDTRIQGGVSPDGYGETSENNKVAQSSDDVAIETPSDYTIDDRKDGERISEDTHEADLENHLSTLPVKEEIDDREELDDGHKSDEIRATGDASIEANTPKSDDILENNEKTEDDAATHDATPDVSSKEASSSINNNINTISYEATSGSSDPTNSLHGSEPATPLEDGMTSESEPIHGDNLLHTETVGSPNEEDINTIASDTLSDVETLHASSPKDGTISHLELLDTEPSTTTETSQLYDKLFTIPTSAVNPSDYNYDAQHDYGAGENLTSSETFDDGPKSTEIDHSTDSSSSTPQTVVDDEGSGDYADSELVSSDNVTSSSSTIGFMEDLETKTEPSSLRTVSDDLADVSSTTISSSTDILSSSSSTDTVTAEADHSSSTTDESLLPDEQTTEPTQVSSESSSTESSSVSPETTSVEPFITEISSEASSSTTSEEPITIDEITTELVTDPPLSSSSSEPSSTQSETVKEVFSSTTAVFWELSSTSEPSSSTETASRRGFWWESEEDHSPVSPSSTTTEDSPISSPGTGYKRAKMIEFTTEKSTTELSEVEVVTELVDGERNQNIMADPDKDADEKTALISGVTYIIIGLLLALILVLLTVVVCRRKSPTKVRLPVDPETAAGTEMQDMLLPKSSSGNGVKVSRPNAYTNGSAAPLTNGKAKLESVKVQDPEEMIPVLQAAPEQEPEPPEPEISWEDKPEPIEAVTARLTMLARPQTPIFIQKPLA